MNFKDPEVRRAYHREWSAANPGYHAAYMRQIREARIEAGKCGGCGVADRRPGLTKCQPCADQNAAMCRASRAKARRRQQETT